MDSSGSSRQWTTTEQVEKKNGEEDGKVEDGLDKNGKKGSRSCAEALYLV